MDKFVVTGGWINMATGYLDRVQEYDINGSVRRLPNLRTARRSHACGHFLNSSNRKVRKVSKRNKLDLFLLKEPMFVITIHFPYLMSA